MGTYGGAYGIPFAFEGIYFFLEAIFIYTYIYGCGPGRTSGPVCRWRWVAPWGRPRWWLPPIG